MIKLKVYTFWKKLFNYLSFFIYWHNLSTSDLEIIIKLDSIEPPKKLVLVYYNHEEFLFSK